MRYDELIHFDPIESVIQLREADNKEQAAQLVRTYVISTRMADQLSNLVIPHLRIDRPADNKGMLIVGNYGTGKSHLMSGDSAVAEHADLVDHCRANLVQAAAVGIGGRFKVWRMEIGAVTKICAISFWTSWRNAWRHWERPIPFPADKSRTTKMPSSWPSGFSQKYPDQGLLLVVDELLDYLATDRRKP